VDSTQATPMAEFHRYLGTVVPPTYEMHTRWRKHADAYPHCPAIARHFLAIPASSAAYEHLFSATGRLINKHCSHLLPEHADSLVFLKRNK